MTELMKRYEEKYGNSPWEEVLTEDFNLLLFVPKFIFFVMDDWIRTNDLRLKMQFELCC